MHRADRRKCLRQTGRPHTIRAKLRRERLCGTGLKGRFIRVAALIAQIGQMIRALQFVTDTAAAFAGRRSSNSASQLAEDELWRAPPERKLR